MLQIIGRISPPTGHVQPPNEVHTEYPKWLHFADKPSLLVADAAEEASVLGGGTPKPPTKEAEPAAPVLTLVGPNDDLTMLRKLAADKGITIDGRWSMKKIRAKIEAAST